MIKGGTVSIFFFRVSFEVLAFLLLFSIFLDLHVHIPQSATVNNFITRDCSLIVARRKQKPNYISSSIPFTLILSQLFNSNSTKRPGGYLPAIEITISS